MIFRLLVISCCVFSPMLIAQFSEREIAERRQLEWAIRTAQARNMRMMSPAASPGPSSKDAAAFRVAKTSNTFTDARLYNMNGNQIVGNIYDYGGIAPGINLLRNTNNMVWRGLGDIYQFNPFVVAAVTDTNGRNIHISSDAINDVDARDINPIDEHVYGWNSIPTGYVDPSSEVMASNPAPDKNGDGKPDSWSPQWYNPIKGQYVWPGYLRQDVPNADLEVLWAMDDNANDEFPYFPIPSDSSKRGLGLKIEGRALQWSNSLAQNCIFFVYTVQNFSGKNLDTVYFGMYGDVDVGGGVPGGAGGDENKDDLAYFISPMDTVHRATGIPVPVFSRSIVYFWDENGLGYLNKPTHYNACKFLESPANNVDGINNDGDYKKNGQPMIDESQTNGIDDDGDWLGTNDDVGVDGVPGTTDYGEGDGSPTSGINYRFPDGTINPLFPGEPNFELTDLDESDQIGLTAFRSFVIKTLRQRDDSIVWVQLERKFIDMDSIPESQDIAFIYGSGKISLKKKGEDGSIKRFSIALLMGANLNDVLISARTVQLIYNQNYQFIRPPDKPAVAAIAGDKKVTLYWDTAAEESVDPILGKDFEGYMIYRSTDPQFSDINTITDGFGTPLLYAPLTNSIGKPARWDIAKRPEPFFEDDTSSTKNGKYDAGERFIDVNQNGVYDAALVDDYWKGFAPVPFDQRGVSFYLGDNTGLVHSYSDSNNVINGQTYYYAVVSYDHGDVTNYSPSEATKRISVDNVTGELLFDVNTVRVTPGPHASGYIPPKITTTNMLRQISGAGTGKVVPNIVDEMKVSDQVTYHVVFNDTLVEGNKKVVATNYSVLQYTPVESDVVLNDTNFVKLGNSILIHDDIFQVSRTSTGQVYTEGSDFVIDTMRGLIRKTSTGAMAGIKGPFTLRYRHYPQPPSRLLNNEEANPVFDGIKLFIQDQSFAIDTLHSAWVIQNGNTNAVVSLYSGGTQKYAPVEVQIIFNSLDTDSAGNYREPGDTLGSLTAGIYGKTVKTPFRIVNVSRDTSYAAMKIRAFVVENTPRNNRWDLNESIVLLTPPSNATSLYQIRFFDSTGAKSIKGSVFQTRLITPFSGEDRFEFTTQAAKFSASAASASMDKIKVVPNPYVAVSDIEPTDRLPGTTRGSRRIYFEHLPPKCTIRIYTISGELVKELDHQTSIDNGREYWDLLNRDNFSVAYGIYIAHIDAPGVGEKILKFGIIK
ncbi:MAG: hypothetical protein WCX28_08730 [Bacteriovoracaceae bacterium]